MANETITRPLPPAIPRPRTRPWTLALLLIGLALIYAYGWRVTQINLGELVTSAGLVRPIVRDLVRPDVLTWAPRLQEVPVPFNYSGAEPAPAPPPAGGARLSLSTSVGRPGTPLEVRGEGFGPNRPGKLMWTDQSGSSADAEAFTTDAQGRFALTLEVPELIGQRHTLTAQVTLEGRQLRFSSAAGLVFWRLIETIFLALMGTTIAVFLALPISFLGAKNLMARSPIGKAVYIVVRTVMNITRSIEPLIMATVFAVWVGIGPFAGVLALALHSVASLGKLYSEQIESIDPGPIEAITATGASPLQVIRYAVVPQIVPPFIAFTIYRWDINVRMSTVIGMVGGGGVGFLLVQFINLLQWQQAATAVWGITLVVAAMDYFSAAVRERVV
ncbi:MAG: phosphonate ABC transporter, permease protein PhnE [bacterium]